jgi:hypothetical protein
MDVRKRLLTAGTGLVALGAAALYVALPGNAATTIKVTEKQVTFALDDVAPKGFSVGDTVTLSNSLTDTSDGSAAGYDTVQCVVERVLNPVRESGLLQCFATVRLARGTLTVQGNLWQNNTSSTLAVTGGTGAYEGAKGNVALPPQTNAGNQLTITLQ